MAETLRVQLPCADCGKAFDGALLMGRRVTSYCSECRETRSRADLFERAQTYEKALAFHRKEWLADPSRGIPMRYLGATWEDFLFDQGGMGNRLKVECFRRYAKEFPVNGFPVGVLSLILARDVNGVGKTLLACLILMEIVNRFEELRFETCPYQFWTVNDLKLRLKAAQRFGARETEEDVYREMATARLLILDDVGKENLTGADAAFSYEMYFTILNRRYNNVLPVILTSNLGFEPWPGGKTSLIALWAAHQCPG